MGWRLARALETLSDEVEGRFPGTTIWTVGDADHRSRPSDHNPHDHDGDPSTAEVVSAIDVVGHEQARALWDHIIRTQDPRVEYQIFNGYWTGSDHDWKIRVYTGANKHTGHCHVSVGRGSDSMVTRPDLFDDPSPWGFHQSEEDDMPTAGEIASAVWAAGVGRGTSRRTLAEVVVQAAADAAAARALAERAAAGDTLTDDQIAEVIRDAARHVRVSVRVEEDET